MLGGQVSSRYSRTSRLRPSEAHFDITESLLPLSPEQFRAPNEPVQAAHVSSKRYAPSKWSTVPYTFSSLQLLLKSFFKCPRYMRFTEIPIMQSPVRISTNILNVILVSFSTPTIRLLSSFGNILRSVVPVSVNPIYNKFFQMLTMPSHCSEVQNKCTTVLLKHRFKRREVQQPYRSTYTQRL